MNNKKCYWFTGLSGSGKSTLGKLLADSFIVRPIILDGDEIRKTVNSDLTLDKKDRNENVRRIAGIAKILIDQGFNVIVTCISKDLNQRENARNLLGDSYIEILVSSSEETRKKRDTKGLYANGIVLLSEYEKSPWKHIIIETDNETETESLENLKKKLQKKF